MLRSRPHQALLCACLLGAAIPVQSQPIGLIPADGQAQVRPAHDTGHVDFEWTAIVGATAYRLEIAKDSGFAEPRVLVFADTVVRATYRDHWKKWDWGTTYFWRVSAVLPEGGGGTSSIRRFTVRLYDDATPGVFAGKGGVGIPFLLDLEMNSNLHGWARLEVATDSAFAGIIDSSAWVRTSRGVFGYANCRFRLEPMKKYFVRAYGGEFPDGPTGVIGEISGPSRFIGPFTTTDLTPGPVTLLDPPEGGVVDFDSVEFTFVRPENGDLAILELSSDGFSEGTVHAYPVEPWHVSSAVWGWTVASPERIVVRGLPGPALTYQWRIRTTYQGRTMGLSPVRTVHEKYDAAGRARSIPITKSPADGGTIVLPELGTGRIGFAWTRAVAAVEYRVLLASGDSTFTSPLAFATTDTALFLALRDSLKTWDWGKTCHWKVEARYSNGTFGESRAASFSLPASDPRAPAMDFRHADGEAPVSLRFAYQPAALKRHYIEASLDPGFTTLTHSSWQPDSAAGTAWPVLRFDHSTRYYVRMFAADPGAALTRRTGPSPVVTFRTVGPSGSSAEILSPADGDTARFDTRIPFHFVKPKDASGLTLEFSADGFQGAPVTEWRVPYSIAADGSKPGADTLIYLMAKWSFAASTIHWRVRSTLDGRSVSLSPSRVLILDPRIFQPGGPDTSAYAPRHQFPEAGTLMDPEGVFFNWTTRRDGTLRSYHFRLTRADPPFPVILDTVITEQRDAFNGGRVSIRKALEPGRKFQWTVRSGTKGRFGSFPPRITFQTLRQSVRPDLCHRINGIGPTRSWEYRIIRTSYGISTRWNPPRILRDSVQVAARFQAADVIRDGKHLRYDLTYRLGDGAPVTDQLRHAGCDPERLDASGNWVPAVSMGDGWFSVTPVPGDARIFLPDSLILLGYKTYAWKRYRGNDLLQFTWRAGAYPLEGTVTPRYGEAVFIEGIGLVSYRMRDTTDLRWDKGSKVETWQLTELDGQPFDPAMLPDIPQEERAIRDSVPEPLPTVSRRKPATLRNLLREQGWLRADLFDITGVRRKRFLPRDAADPGSLPGGIHLLRMDYPEGPRRFLIAE